MNVFILAEIARLFKTFHKINYIGRISDNLIKLHLDNEIFYVNLEKSKSSIFCTNEAILGSKKYQAPFDFALQKYCLKAIVKDCDIDGNNRILRLFLHKKLEYKEINGILQFEFTGKYTNAIIMDMDCIILESLRKITQNLRIIKPGIKLTPLPQQTNFTPRQIDFGNDIMQYLKESYAKNEQANLQNAKNTAISTLKAKKEKLQNLLSQLENKESLLAKAKEYAKIGYLLQNNINTKITQSKINLKDYDNTDIEVEIPHDMLHLSNTMIINKLFTKSKKLHLKSQNIAIQEQNLCDNINFLAKKIEFITHAKTLSDIQIILPKHQTSKKNSQDSKLFESFFIDGIKISIGKNQRENIALLHNAKANDMWMHIRDIPSSHLIIHCSKNTIKDEILRKAGEILVGFVKAKSGNFMVDYTKRKFVKIKEGANVVYANYATLNIKK